MIKYFAVLFIGFCLSCTDSSPQSRTATSEKNSEPIHEFHFGEIVENLPETLSLEGPDGTWTVDIPTIAEDIRDWLTEGNGGDLVVNEYDNGTITIRSADPDGDRQFRLDTEGHGNHRPHGHFEKLDPRAPHGTVDAIPDQHMYFFGEDGKPGYITDGKGNVVESKGSLGICDVNNSYELENELSLLPEDERKRYLDDCMRKKSFVGDLLDGMRGAVVLTVLVEGGELAYEVVVLDPIDVTEETAAEYYMEKAEDFVDELSKDLNDSWLGGGQLGEGEDEAFQDMLDKRAMLIDYARDMERMQNRLDLLNAIQEQGEASGHDVEAEGFIEMFDPVTGKTRAELEETIAEAEENDGYIHLDDAELLAAFDWFTEEYGYSLLNEFE